MNADQIKERVAYYDAILSHWQKTLSDFPDFDGADELRLDLNELEAYRNALAYRITKERRSECAARRRTAKKGR